MTEPRDQATLDQMVADLREQAKAERKERYEALTFAEQAAYWRNLAQG